MASRVSVFTRNYSARNASETMFLEYFVHKEQEKVIFEEEGSKQLYVVMFEEFNLLRRHTRSYVKKLRGLKVIPTLPRRQAPKKAVSYTKDSLLVENLEELVDLSIQEITQPIDQLGP